MSGGRYDYLWFKISDFACFMETRDDPRRIAFAKLLSEASKVCKDIEWEDSGDTSKPNTDKSIDDFFTFVKDQLQMKVLERGMNLIERSGGQFMRKYKMITCDSRREMDFLLNQIQQECGGTLEIHGFSTDLQGRTIYYSVLVSYNE